MIKAAPRYADVPSSDGMDPGDATVPCVCCDAAVDPGAEYCACCLAPADLTRLARVRENAAQFVSVLGASGAGKTVYLGLLLDMLGSGDCGMRGLATGAFSIGLQESVIMALEHRMFPEKTPVEADLWNWVHSEVCMSGKDKETYWDLISPDVAGESIHMELQRPGTYPAIQRTIERSRGVMILCDSLKVRDSGPAEDLFALKLATYVASLHGAGRGSGLRRRRADVSLAIVFTKCDSCPEAQEDPASLARTNLPRTAEYCRVNFSRYEYFAASAAGSSAVLSDGGGCQRRIPLHIEPRGVVEPLAWILR